MRRLKLKKMRIKVNLIKQKQLKTIHNVNNIYTILLCLISIFFSISIQRQNLTKINKLIFDSEIILTIKGTGNQPILNNKTIKLWDRASSKHKNYIFNDKPSEIFVNGNKINKIDFYVYNLTLKENNITIRFNKTLTNCNVMFFGLSNIIKIKFNIFDFSGTNMIGIFGHCSNILSFDLNNFDTSSVIRMDYMFENCNKLISLDLSKFNTSNVQNMYHLIYECYSI